MKYRVQTYRDPHDALKIERDDQFIEAASPIAAAEVATGVKLSSVGEPEHVAAKVWLSDDLAGQTATFYDLNR